MKRGGVWAWASDPETRVNAVSHCYSNDWCRIGNIPVGISFRGIHVSDHPPRAGRPSSGDVRMSQIVSSVQAEYLRYKGLAEAAIAQLSDADLVVPGPGDGNSIAVLCWHLAGNFRSRFTDFLTSDGEKPWRHREEEFGSRAISKQELLAYWEESRERVVATRG